MGGVGAFICQIKLFVTVIELSKNICRIVAMKMDSCETITERYLQDLKISNIKFEPLGHSRPPDFSLDNEIGVEVTRITKTKNQQHSVSIAQSLQKIVENYDAPPDGYSCFVAFSFQKPIEVSKLRNKIKIALTEQHSTKSMENKVIPIGPNLSISFLPTQTKNEKSFLFAGFFDHSDSGFTGDILPDCILRIGKEKQKKMEGISDQFAEWWLVLVNTLTGMFDTQTSKMVQKRVDQTEFWDRVIILEPRMGPKAKVFFPQKPSKLNQII